MHLFKLQKKKHRKVSREIVAGFLLVASISGVAFHEYLVGILRKFCIIHGRARSALTVRWLPGSFSPFNHP